MLTPTDEAESLCEGDEGSHTANTALPSTLRCELGVYRVGESLGEGAYGHVYRAQKVSGPGPLHVAVKVSFDSLRKNEGVSQQLMREVMGMSLTDHPGIMPLLALSAPLHSGNRQASGLWMPLMAGDLSTLVNTMRETLTPEEYRLKVKQVTAQMLSALSRLHMLGVIHRDIKPSNILFTGGARDPEVTLADLGLCRFVESSGLQSHTGKVQSLWYRAPEVFWKSERQTTEADVWSLGVTIAEMLLPPESRSPLLSKADCEVSAIMIILSLIGHPTAAVETKYLETLPLYNPLLPRCAGKLRTLFPCDGTRRFLKRMLRITPFLRAAAVDLLQDKWFAEIRSYVSSLPITPSPVCTQVEHMNGTLFGQQPSLTDFVEAKQADSSSQFVKLDFPAKPTKVTKRAIRKRKK